MKFPIREKLFEAIKKMVISVDDNLILTTDLSGSINPFIDYWLKPFKKKVEKDVEQEFEKEYFIGYLSELRNFETFFHEYMTSDDSPISEIIKLFIKTMQDSSTPIPEELFAYDPAIETLVSRSGRLERSTSRIFGDELLTF